MARIPLNSRVLIPAGVVTLVALVVGAVALSSGGPDPEAAGTTTTEPMPTTTVTTLAPTTTVAPSTTTLYSGPVAPLTGLPVDDESLLDRSVLGIKIDNHPKSRPQSGLNEAEAVYEIVVEGGLTRFLALFHTTDSDYLGPMRSARPTDAELMKPLGGTFAISGASNWVLRYFGQYGIERLGEGSGKAFRIESRRAPHNLYVDTKLLREAAEEHGHSNEPPPVLWDFGAFPEDAAKATSVTTSFTRFVRSTWTWNGMVYERSIGDDPHLLISQEEVEAEQAAAEDEAEQAAEDQEAEEAEEAGAGDEADEVEEVVGLPVAFDGTRAAVV